MSDPGSVLLDFGKHKGRAIRELPTEYLAFLCCYEHEVAHGSDNVERVDRQNPGPTEWLSGSGRTERTRSAPRASTPRTAASVCTAYAGWFPSETAAPMAKRIQIGKGARSTSNATS